jgi:hypothetical protein
MELVRNKRNFAATAEVPVVTSRMRHGTLSTVNAAVNEVVAGSASDWALKLFSPQHLLSNGAAFNKDQNTTGRSSKVAIRSQLKRKTCVLSASLGAVLRQQTDILVLHGCGAQGQGGTSGISSTLNSPLTGTFNNKGENKCQVVSALNIYVVCSSYLKSVPLHSANCVKLIQWHVKE